MENQKPEQKPKQSKTEPFKIRLTKRDLNIICFLNEVGFCEMPQLEKKFSIKKPRSYQIMKRLVKAGLVNHQRIFHNRPGAFQASRDGAEYTDLPYLAKISKHYHHQIMLTEVYIKLAKLYPNADLISERRLQRDKYLDKAFEKFRHVPDGLLIFPDERTVPFEVELTLKSRKRLERIFKGYTGQFSIKEVWYYCSPNLMAPLKALAVKHNLSVIKILNIEELLS